MITFRNLTICHTVVKWCTVQSTQVIKSTTYYYYIVYLLSGWDQSSRYEYNEITKIFSLFFFKNIWLIDIWCLTRGSFNATFSNISAISWRTKIFGIHNKTKTNKKRRKNGIFKYCYFKNIISDNLSLKRKGKNKKKIPQK